MVERHRKVKKSLQQEQSKTHSILTSIELFSNTERPLSMPPIKANRQFSGNLEMGVQFKPKKVLQSAALASIPEDDIRRRLYETVPNDRECMSSLQFGKSIQNSIVIDQ